MIYETTGVNCLELMRASVGEVQMLRAMHQIEADERQKQYQKQSEKPI